MAALSVFRDEIAAEVPGCPGGLIDREVRYAVIEFCRKTDYWQADLDAITTVADQETYALTPPAESVVANVVRVRFDGTTIFPVTDTHQLQQAWETNSCTSPSSYLIRYDSGAKVLRPYPIVDRVLADAIVVRVSLKPTLTTVVIDDSIHLEYTEAIAGGALRKLLMMSGRKWHNPQLAAFYATKFNDGVNRAKIADLKNHTNGDLMVRMRPFA